jgi:hypothetical protein
MLGKNTKFISNTTSVDRHTNRPTIPFTNTLMKKIILLYCIFLVANNITLSGKAPGLYFIKVAGSNGIKTSKVVIQ